MSAQSSLLLSGVVVNDSVSAVIFIILLWRSVTDPPVLHVNEWSMLYFALQTHLCCKCLSSHPHFNKSSSKN